MQPINAIPAEVMALNFSAIKKKMMDPVEGNGASVKHIECCEAEYRKFLALRFFYPKEDLAPNRWVDEFWHAHILDTMAYVADCNSLFGNYLHHYPYMGIGSAEARQELSDAFTKTKTLYELHFGSYPEDEAIAARCKGHACHSPSPCACRVPGACKAK
ncbi:hypothetical protein AU476_19235 [Cupriavidus sp. UYMSc13B]|nr:hypothetical protein AU476_19235 [Cupriavidus sp. UYMSc13B]